MLGSLIIVFREVLEAGLVVGIVLAASEGLPARGRWISAGIVGGLIGACLVALFADEIAGLFADNGQELFNASLLILGVAMLTWHNAWMAQHGRELVQHVRSVGQDIAGGRQPVRALAIVVGVAVLREGSEVVLFLYGIAVAGGSSPLAMAAGGLVGIILGAGVAWLLYRGLLRIPARDLFAVTGALIALLAAGMASSAAQYLMQAGILTVGTAELWNTSAILSDGTLLGQTLHVLVGYTARPVLAQLVTYLCVLALMTGLSHRGRTAAASGSGTGAAVHRAGA
ncbi:MAG: FTR1 family protein [Azospirillaceae bacterium]|nr:FTR1 family protein [Azospirillaceae bacterium]